MVAVIALVVNLPKIIDFHMIQPTDYGPADGQTDIASYREVRVYLFTMLLDSSTIGTAAIQIEFLAALDIVQRQK